jgi:signal transduction histidine kinase
MAGAIAHEINTPLATISLLGAQISELTSGLQAPLTTSDELAQVRAKAVQLEATASRISRIIQSMKAMSRMSASDPLELTRVSEWVDDTLVLCLEKFRNGGVRVECVTHEQDLKVSCQPAEIGQVLLNLLNNAWDSIRSSPRADGSTSSGWIRLSWGTAPDGKIEFRVEDSGAQIPDSARQKLFQPFFTTKPVGQGTGIGLALSRRIMERHGGTLRLEQAEGKKAFVLEFPGASPQ